MTAPRRFLPPALLAMLLCGALLTGCSSSPPQPQTTANAYLAAWAKQDWAAMRRLTSAPPADFTAVNQAAFTNLAVRQAAFTAGAMQKGNATASAPVTERLTLAGLGTITIKSALHLVMAQGKWLVKWSPATIAPQLRAGDQLSLKTTWPARAAILGPHGTPLTSQGQVVTIGVEGARVKDAASLKSALVAAGAPAAAAGSAITAAKAHPTFFEPVFTVTRARYNQLEPAIYPLPGTVFQTSTALTALTPGLTAGVVGTVGPVTAQELSQLGAPYTAQNIVGQTGLEQADERQLAGPPGATVTVVSSGGAHVATLATLPAQPGTPVRTTIDPTVQRAAEAALAAEKKNAALVAVNAATGDGARRGVGQRRRVRPGLDGAFPPGSSFKVITSTALISHGLTPRSAASCPRTVTVDGEVFHNAEGEPPVSDLLHAFAESCNTAFIGLATRHLSPADFPTAAAMFGLGRDRGWDCPPSAARCPRPADEADLAATDDRAGPGAGVAAGHGDGRGRGRHRHRARAAAGDRGARGRASRRRRRCRRAGHRPAQMMAQVVASGTAAGQGLPAGTFAKTGTAQYGSGHPLPTDAWLIGFKGDIAFAMVVVDGGEGGPTDGPLVARFLSGL